MDAIGLEDKIKSGEQKIDRLLEREPAPKKMPTKKSIILGLQAAIAKMRAKNWSWDAIAKALKDEEIIDATAETIRLVYDGKQKKKSMKDSKRKERRHKTAPVVDTPKNRSENLTKIPPQDPNAVDLDAYEAFGPPES